MSKFLSQSNQTISIFDIEHCITYLKLKIEQGHTYSDDNVTKINYSNKTPCGINNIELHFKYRYFSKFLKNKDYPYFMQSILLLFKENTIGVAQKTLENLMLKMVNSDGTLNEFTLEELENERLKTIKSNDYYRKPKPRFKNDFEFIDFLESIKHKY